MIGITDILKAFGAITNSITNKPLIEHLQKQVQQLQDEKKAMQEEKKAMQDHHLKINAECEKEKRKLRNRIKKLEGY